MVLSGKLGTLHPLGSKNYHLGESSLSYFPFTLCSIRIIHTTKYYIRFPHFYISLSVGQWVTPRFYVSFDNTQFKIFQQVTVPTYIIARICFEHWTDMIRRGYWQLLYMHHYRRCPHFILKETIALITHQLMHYLGLSTQSILNVTCAVIHIFTFTHISHITRMYMY